MNKLDYRLLFILFAVIYQDHVLSVTSDAIYFNIPILIMPYDSMQHCFYYIETLAVPVCLCSKLFTRKAPYLPVACKKQITLQTQACTHALGGGGASPPPTPPPPPHHPPPPRGGGGGFLHPGNQLYLLRIHFITS
jgi:hypothetical protein